MSHRFADRIGSALAGCALFAVSACTAADYADGVGAFSKAVIDADTANQALVAAEHQARLNVWQKHNAAAPIVIDRSACSPLGAYKPGSCVVMLGSEAAPQAEPSKMEALVGYSALLSAIVADKTCETIQSDGAALATVAGDIDAAAGGGAAASEAGAASALASTAGCWILDNYRLDLLRRSTAQANAPVQKLVALIANDEKRMFDTVIRENTDQLYQVTVAYQQSRTPAELNKAISLAEAIDKAQKAPPAKAIGEIGTLHQKLTDELAKPTVTLARVLADAQSLSAAASASATAIQTLKTAGTTQ